VAHGVGDRVVGVGIGGIRGIAEAGLSLTLVVAVAMAIAVAISVRPVAVGVAVAAVGGLSEGDSA